MARSVCVLGLAVVAVVGMLGAGAAAPVGTVSQIVLAQSADLTNLDATYFTDQPTRGVAQNIVEPLFRRGRDFKAQNLLAESIKASDDFTVWEVSIKRNIKFHNGDSLDAGAVKFTIDRIIDPARRPPSILKSKIDVIEGVEVVNPSTIRIRLKNPDPFLKERLANVPIVSPRYYAAHDAAYLNTNINGTGPFKFVEWVKGDRVVLEANPDYWGGRPRLDRAIYRIVPEGSSRVAALRTGAADVIGGVPIDFIDPLRTESEIKLEAMATEYTVIIAINSLRGGPLADRRFRQALSYGVDVNAIVSHILKGRGARVPSIVGKQNFGYADLTARPYDPQRAKELLSGVRIPPGYELTLMAPDGRFPKDREVAQAVVGYLRFLGLDVKLQTMPFQEFIQVKNAKKLSDLWMVGWSSGTLDALDNMTWIAVSKSTLWAEQIMENLESDRLMKLAASTRDLKARAEYLRGVQKLFYDEAYAISMYSVVDTYGVRTRVVGWSAPTDELMTVGAQTSVR